MLTFTTSTRHATNGIHLNKHLNRLVIPAGILRIPVFSVPVALFSQESRFLYRRNFFGAPSGILSVWGLRRTLRRKQSCSRKKNIHTYPTLNVDYRCLLCLKKYTYVYSWTRDQTAGVKSIFCAPADCVKGNMSAGTAFGTCNSCSLAFAASLDLIIIIRP